MLHDPLGKWFRQIHHLHPHRNLSSKISSELAVGINIYTYSTAMTAKMEKEPTEI